ncbi:MAG: hypothetical protein Q7T44_02810 [Parvibaculum sp.]|nr:hypothetical protein [Parvibaculum sp.]
MKNILIALSVCGVLAACSATTQTTSGSDYLARHGYQSAAAPATAVKSETFDQALIKAANVEPTLTFPARIGLARISRGSLSSVSGAEAEVWSKAGAELGASYGTFVPLSPLVAAAASAEYEQTVNQYEDRAAMVMRQIRLGAARQHLDAVLVYETYSSSDEKSNLLEIANLTIIGGFILPSQQVTLEGYGTAMLIDVMSGYPYGAIEATVPKERHLASAWGWGNDSYATNNAKISLAVTGKLAKETTGMFKQLRMELAEQRAKTAEKTKSIAAQ